VGAQKFTKQNISAGRCVDIYIFLQQLH